MVIPVGSLQLLLTIEDQMACLGCARRHLAPGGRLAFELDNTSAVVMAQWLTQRRGTLQPNPQRDYRHPLTGCTREATASGDTPVQ